MKAKILLDTNDLKIYKALKKDDGQTIGQLKKEIKITHASLIPHLKRLEKLNVIHIGRVKQKKFVCLDHYEIMEAFC